MKLSYKVKILLTISLISALLLSYHEYRNILRKTELELSVYPRGAVANIGGRIYHLKKEKQIIKVSPGKYTLAVTYPGYYPQTQTISLENNERKSLYISLIPIEWPRKTLIENKNIQEFYLVDKGNKIIYLVSFKDKKDKLKYRLLLFNRSNKKSSVITESYNKPIFIDISPRKILYRINSYYYLKFLSSYLPVSSIELQNYLQKNTKQRFKIQKVFFSPLQEDSIIFQTTDAIYQFNFLEDELKKIVSKKIAFCTLINNKIYFFTPEGLLFSYDFKRGATEQESLFVFKIKEGQNPKICTTNNNLGILILDSSRKLYYLNKKALPKLLTQGVSDFYSSPKHDKILVCKDDSALSLLKIEGSEQQNINIRAEKIISWLSGNLYFLYLNKNSLFIYSLPQNKSFILAKDILHNQVQIDNSLKQIFYLDSQGIQITQW